MTKSFTINVGDAVTYRHVNHANQLVTRHGVITLIRWETHSIQLTSGEWVNSGQIVSVTKGG